MKAWFRGIEKGRTVYQKIGYVDRCGTIGFLQGFSSFLFKRLVFLLLTINRPTVVNPTKISSLSFELLTA